MSLRKGKFFRFFLASLFSLVAIPVGLLVSSILFQGHMHPDDWGHIWQEIPIIVTIVVAYVFYIGKVILRKGDEFENS